MALNLKRRFLQVKGPSPLKANPETLRAYGETQRFFFLQPWLHKMTSSRKTQCGNAAGHKQHGPQAKHNILSRLLGVRLVLN
jgi:hypothetical protein